MASLTIRSRIDPSRAVLGPDSAITRPQVAEGLAASAGLVFISPKRAAIILDVKESTLERWRVIGRGPRYRKLNGAVRYSIIDIENWVTGCRSGGGHVAA